MKKLVVVLIVAALGWKAWGRYHREVETSPPSPAIAVAEPLLASTPAPEPEPAYRCDGRTRCSQMHSCKEATWVLRNCPGPEMDGDKDGVPCETQWCN